MRNFLRLRDKNRAQWYQYGKKTGKILAKIIKDQQPSTSIVKLLKTDGDLTYDPKEILKEFYTYYSNLYNIKTNQGKKEKEKEREGIKKYIEETTLPMFPKETAEDLEKEISIEEIQQAIEPVPGKSPGPDGYTARFYKTFQDIITPILKETYNSISSIQSFVPQSTEAHIILIPKSEKDHTLCKNYRRISKTNIDIRLYSKIILNRLIPILPNHIKLEQTGFTKGRETKNNIIKTCTLVEYADVQTRLLAVDAEKAFDRVGWQFLEETLMQIGMGPKMLSRIIALYSISRAKVRINGVLSEDIKISNGTHQGCPLSPLLFILVMEITAIRKK